MIRDIGHIRWKDPLQWMESMRGERWNTFMKRERRRFHTALNESSTKKSLEHSTNAFISAAKEEEEGCSFLCEEGGTKIILTWQANETYKWSWESHEMPLAGDIDISASGTVVYSTDLTSGSLQYKVVALQKHREIWYYEGIREHGLGGNIAIMGDRVYMIEASAPLSYRWLISVDLETGKSRKVHYEEKDPYSSIYLYRGENRCLFMIADNAGKQCLYHIGHGGKVQQLSKEKGVVFHPVGYAKQSEEPCYFVCESAVDMKWKACGEALEALKFPENLGEHGIDWMSISCGLLIHRAHGERIFDLCSHRRKPKRVYSIFGEILPHFNNGWLGHIGIEQGVEMILQTPGSSPIRAFFSVKGALSLAPSSVYGKNVLGWAKSSDGERVRWACTWDRDRGAPRGLIVTGYGAYGSPTSFFTSRWKPYIEKGFAIGIALIRGGGDHNQMWAYMGKKEGKIGGIEDFEACIRAIQGHIGLGADKTCIFGRSAGGYLVGSTLVRNTDGNLFKYLYTESPYVDVLQTSTNPDLPLTLGEYGEFGDPARSIADFETILRIGPVSGLGTNGVPGIFVLCRAGTKDRQVYAYESAKWITILRGKNTGDDTKLLFISEGEGHAVYGKKGAQERAEDYLILCKKMGL